MPVALAFGVASGLRALAGIYGAIAVGFFAAVFSGTKSQISGSTGPMAVAMAAVVTIHADNLAQAFAIVILAGLIQILLGLMRVGRLVAFTPYSVISGFMSGIGVISADIHDHEVLTLDFTDTLYVDDSAALVVEQLIDTAIEENTPVIMMGLDGFPADTLRSLNVLEKVPGECFVADPYGVREVATGRLQSNLAP